ncbi:outer membrane protein TolC [Silvibacterium bohemicum]|uniref:Outer membrane protein TolC n=1 Tax=Silvibacterium bohemicum TaxID=1577686 RepID=A0A841JPL8_9BACT|nr:TolC family protein [Silvibacterium bohemicum]MBB6143090.1 outer membrane protein TolC [Silvibacterium bohemicum]
MTSIFFAGRRTTVALFIVLIFATAVSYAQQGQQPPPFTVPASPLPDTAHAPGQQAPPAQQQPGEPPSAPLPQPDKSTVDVRQLAPLSTQPPSPANSFSDVERNANFHLQPQKEAPSPLDTHFYSLIGAYRAPHLPGVPAGSTSHLERLINDGKLYLSLHDAIELAIENNMDVEISRYDLLLANTDLTRAQGGGTLRGVDYNVQQSPPGVSAATSPLLITATTGNGASTNATVTDLSQVEQIGSGTQQSLSENGTFTYSDGPPIPLYDPTLSGDAAYLRRSDQTSLLGSSTTGGSSTIDTSTSTGPLDYVSAGLDYQQGFSTGTQIEAYADNASQVLYGKTSQYDPFHSPSASFTVSQPLLRGFGRGINLRFLHIAQIDQKVSRLVFEQQLLETIYGISRLYYDLVSLGENIGVKEEALAAAQHLYDDDKSQVDEGTLAPIELTRVKALLSSSRLDLIQAQGEYRQQEVILREQLLRKLGDPAANFASIVPTDRIVVPDDAPTLDIPALIQDALANRPDLAQAGLQLKADEIAARASRNNVKPSVNLYANVQTRGSSLIPFEELGSPGTGTVIVPPELTQGGLTLSTIYQGGLQLSLPLRNRIAQADAARDQIQMRQAEARTTKVENDIRQQIENAAIALENAHQAYAAAVESRDYQQQLLQAELDKFSVGESTNYLIVQDQAYLAQARSTEVAARSDWMKARMSLDRALGDLLERSGINIQDAVRGQLP